jgi:hypothetical protein
MQCKKIGGQARHPKEWLKALFSWRYAACRNSHVVNMPIFQGSEKQSQAFFF